MLTTTENVNVSPALLSAGGVWNLKLKQYKLNGTFLAENEQAYTSGDMQTTGDITYSLPWSPNEL